MSKFTVQFVKEKETPGTIKFAEKSEPGQPPKVKTLYLQKWVVGDATEVTVTVELK